MGRRESQSIRRACDRCHNRKLRCDRSNKALDAPCDRCRRAAAGCIFSRRNSATRCTKIRSNSNEHRSHSSHSSMNHESSSFPSSTFSQQHTIIGDEFDYNGSKNPDAENMFDTCSMQQLPELAYDYSVNFDTISGALGTSYPNIMDSDVSMLDMPLTSLEDPFCAPGFSMLATVNDVYPSPKEIFVPELKTSVSGMQGFTTVCGLTELVSDLLRLFQSTNARSAELKIDDGQDDWFYNFPIGDVLAISRRFINIVNSVTAISTFNGSLANARHKSDEQTRLIRSYTDPVHPTVTAFYESDETPSSGVSGWTTSPTFPNIENDGFSNGPHTPDDSPDALTASMVFNCYIILIRIYDNAFSLIHQQLQRLATAGYNIINPNYFTCGFQIKDIKPSCDKSAKVHSACYMLLEMLVEIEHILELQQYPQYTSVYQIDQAEEGYVTRPSPVGRLSSDLAGDIFSSGACWINPGLTKAVLRREALLDNGKGGLESLQRTVQGLEQMLRQHRSLT